MNPNLPFGLGSILSLIRYPLALLGSVLPCLIPLAAGAQSVTLANAQRTLAFGGLSGPPELPRTEPRRCSSLAANNPKKAPPFDGAFSLPLSSF